jgi:phosphopantetheinyl transferase (holo-ACP synthase)
MSDLPGFLRQILTEKEISDHEGIHADPALCATLFAIKEAVLKALRCGLDRGPAWHELEITPDFRAILSGSVQRLANERSIKNILIAPARAGNVAMALAIAET